MDPDLDHSPPFGDLPTQNAVCTKKILFFFVISKNILEISCHENTLETGNKAWSVCIKLTQTAQEENDEDDKHYMD